MTDHFYIFINNPGKKVLFSIAFIFLGSALFSACSKSDEQKEFENAALREPENITETNAGGEISGSTDPDDWRISPMYRGLITFGSANTQLPFPNPVNYISDLTIQIFQNVPDAVRALDIRSLQFTSDAPLLELKYISGSELSNFNTITIPARTIAGTQGNSANDIYRILIYDARQNLISYGDVRIE